MFKRLVTLLFVALISGMVGTTTGILIAPAAGAETRERMTIFFEEHGTDVREGVQWSRQFLGDVVGFISSQLSRMDGKMAS